MIKTKKLFLIFIVAMTIGAFLSLTNINSQLEKISYEKESVSDDWLYYAGKKRECAGKANTTSALVNGAGLTDCGGDLAVEAKLKIVSLSDIYYNYCNMGFGVAVYGCTIPLTRQVYVCMPGTTLYDRRNTYVSRYFIQYEYISYACNDVSISNTIRHELLHLVYFDLSESERATVNSKLARYEPQYASEIELYSSSERAGELFVRVGADERKVDDIQLVDLYSKVSAAYTAQKQEYYKSLENVADEYLEKYEDLSGGYSALRASVIIFLIINIVTLVALAFSSRNHSGDTAKKNRYLLSAGISAVFFAVLVLAYGMSKNLGIPDLLLLVIFFIIIGAFLGLFIESFIRTLGYTGERVNNLRKNVGTKRAVIIIAAIIAITIIYLLIVMITGVAVFPVWI